MSSPNLSNADNQIFYMLVLEAQQFIDELTDANLKGISFNETMDTMRAKAEEMSSSMGIDYNVVVQALLRIYEAGGMAKEQLEELAATSEMGQLKEGLKQADEQGINLGSTLRMIEGVIVSMVVFQGIQMIASALRDATTNALDYFRAIQNISVAQTALAQQGVDVTNQQMLDIVDQLHQKWQTISQVDITAAVAQAGLMASEYHLSVDQMTQLANEAAILHQLDPSKSMAEYVTQLAKALEGGRSLAANGEQIAFTTEQLRKKAEDLGLVQQGSKAALTDQQKILAGMALEYDRLNPEEQKLTAEIRSGNSVLVQNEEASAKWKDMTTATGEALAGVGNLYKSIGVSLAEFAMFWFRIFQHATLWFDVTVASFLPFNRMVQLAYALEQLLAGNVHSLADFQKALEDSDGLLARMIEKVGKLSMIPDWRNLGASQMSGTDLSNTPVSPFGGQDVTGASSIDESKLNSILDTVAKDYQTYYSDVERATEEFNNKMQDMQDRYNLDVQKEEQNFALRVSEEKQNFRLKELQQEQDFREKMRELQDRYLLDLEDALRKRDAEAVIKTIERYQSEKTTAEQQEKLKQEQDKQAEQLKLKQMKEEEQLRLQQMKAEYDLQRAEAQRAYQQQLNDLAQSLDQKLQEEAVKAQQDLGLNTNSIDSIYKLFTEYYGANGKFAQQQQGAYTKMIEQSQGFVDQMAIIMQEYGQILSTLGQNEGGGIPTLGNPPPLPAPTPPPGGSGGGGGGRKMAAGGVALAASATSVTFGEAGPELALFLPLNSAGSPSLGGVTNGLSGGGPGGLVTIALQMSPDLEARLVNTTLTHAAIQIERVYRSHA